MEMRNGLRILCVYLAMANVTVAVNRQVVRNQANTIDTSEKPTDASDEVFDDQSVKEGGGIIASYEYGYNVNDPLSNDIKSHHEIRDGDHVYGYYTFKEADGSTRVVNYKVGPNTGFQASVERLQLGEQPAVQLPTKVLPPPRVEELDSLPTQASSRTISRSKGRLRDSFHADTHRSQYIEPPARVSSYDRKYKQDQRPSKHTKHTSARISSYERKYKQDQKPVRGRPRAGPEPSHSPHYGHAKVNPDFQNSVIGRKHIQRQIAILAEKKRQEAEAKAAQEAANAAQDATNEEESEVKEETGKEEVKEQEAKQEEVEEEEEGEEEEEDEDREEEVEDYEDAVDREIEALKRENGE